MAYEPQLAPAGSSNVYDEHIYRIRVTFVATSIASYRSKDATIARTGIGLYTITLPKNYEAITDFNYSMEDASGALMYAVIASSTVGADGKVFVAIRTSDGTNTDPDVGDVGYFTLSVSSDVLNAEFTG